MAARDLVSGLLFVGVGVYGVGLLFVQGTCGGPAQAAAFGATLGAGIAILRGWLRSM